MGAIGHCYRVLRVQEIVLLSCWHVGNTAALGGAGDRATPGIPLPCEHTSTLLWAFSPSLKLYPLKPPSVIKEHPL